MRLGDTGFYSVCKILVQSAEVRLFLSRSAVVIAMCKLSTEGTKTSGLGAGFKSP